MKNCKDCKSKNISVTKDGPFGIRAHCLDCGCMAPVKEETQENKGPYLREPQDPENKE